MKTETKKVLFALVLLITITMVFGSWCCEKGVSECIDFATHGPHIYQHR